MRMSKLSVFATALLYGVATLAVLAAVGLMGWAAFMLFDQHLLPWQAALATAGSLLLFALLLVLLRKAWKSFQRGYQAAQQPPQQKRSDIEQLLDPGLMALIRSKPRSAVLVAMAAGTALGASPEIRRKVGVILTELGRESAEKYQAPRQPPPPPR